MRKTFLYLIFIFIGGSALQTFADNTEVDLSIDYKPEFGISDSRFSCYARFPIGAYYICPPNNMDGKMQGL